LHQALDMYWRHCRHLVLMKTVYWTFQGAWMTACVSTRRSSLSSPTGRNVSQGWKVRLTRKLTFTSFDMQYTVKSYIFLDVCAQGIARINTAGILPTDIPVLCKSQYKTINQVPKMIKAQVKGHANPQKLYLREIKFYCIGLNFSGDARLFHEVSWNPWCIIRN